MIIGSECGNEEAMQRCRSNTLVIIHSLVLWSTIDYLNVSCLDYSEGLDWFLKLQVRAGS